MERLSRFLLRHRLPVGLCWLAVLVVGVATAGSVSGRLTTDFSLPGADSHKANQAILRTYGNGGDARPLVPVVTLPLGTTVDSPGVRQALGRTFDAVAGDPRLRVVSFASTGDRGFVSADGRTTWRRLGSPRLEALIGAGVFYGAAASEARAMQGRHVCVVGSANSAGQAAAYLAKHADSVTLLVRGDSLASMSQYLANQLLRTPNVTVRLGVEVVDGEGDGRLKAVTSSSGCPRPRSSPKSAPSRTEWLQGSVARDRSGYVLTGADLLRGGDPRSDWPLARPPLLFETSLPGVFAAGDVRHGSIKRVASAVSEGAVAVQLVHQYLAERQGAIAPAFAERTT